MPFHSWLGPRGQVILRTSSWSLIAKMASAANLFLSVPFVLHALGPTEFGEWATLASLVVFAGFLDFGLGNGTMNLVAAAHGRNDMEEIAAILQEGRKTLWKIAATLAVVVVIAVPLIPWYRLLGQPLALAENSRSAAASVLFAIVLAIPLNLANRVQLGLGRGSVAFRWQTVGQLITLGLITLLARDGASLPVLTAATVFTPLLGSFANTLSLFRTSVYAPPCARRPDLARRIRHEGLLFFVLQLAAALAYSADLPLISALRGPDDAGMYAIVQRLFSIVPLGLSLVWVPLWPVYRHALAARNHEWVMRTLRRSLVLALGVSTTAVLVLALGFERITALWVHRPLVVSGTLLTGFAVWTVIDAIGNALATIFNAASIMRYQIIVASAFAVVCVSGKAFFVSHLGTSTLPWVTIATYVTINLLPTLLLGRRLLTTAFAKFH